MSDYKIKRGDTLLGISRSSGWTPLQYLEVIAANNIDNPDYIHAGRTLWIPELQVARLEIVLDKTLPILIMPDLVLSTIFQNMSAEPWPTFNPTPTRSNTNVVETVLPTMPVLPKSSTPVNTGPLTTATRINAQQIYDFFRANGMSDICAKAFAGNLMHESNGWIYAHGDKLSVKGGSHYLALWNGSRMANLHRLYGNRPNALQLLQFVLWELNNTEKEAWKKIQQATNVKDATIAVRKYYERPSLYADASRFRFTKDIQST